jgi:iron(III) transport system permease protein
LFALVLAFGIYLTVVPAAFLLMGTFMKLFGFFDLPNGAWTLRHWRDALGGGGLLEGLQNTFLMSAGAATISAVFFAMLAYVLVRTKLRFKSAADFMTWIPQALPGIVLTLAWFWIILRTPFLRPLYGSLWALILVSAVGGMTLSVQILKANVMQLGSDLEESSEIAGASWWRTLTRIVVPLLMPTLVVVWVLNYVFTASTAVTPALLASAGTKPLALLQLEYLIGEDRGPASVIGVVLLLSTVSVAVIARMLGFRVGLSRNT